MFCDNCGNKLPDSARFCTRCGQPVTTVKPEYEIEEDFDDLPEAGAEPEYEAEYEEEPMQSAGPPKWVVILFVCLAAAAVAAALYFVVIRPRLDRDTKDETAVSSEESSLADADSVIDDGKNEAPDSIQACIAAWKAGDLDDLMYGMTPAQKEEQAEKAAIEQELREEYAEFFEEEDESSGEENARTLNLLLQYTQITADVEKDPEYPFETEVTVKGPDAAAILEELGYWEYEDPEKLLEDLNSVLEKGEYETRETTVPVTFIMENGSVCAERNEPLVRAFYGGMIELNEEAYAELFEALYEEVNKE